MPIYRMFTRRRVRSPRRSPSLPSSLPSRRSRWVRAMRSNASFASCGLTSMLPLSQIPNSCEKEPRSTISSTLIESSSGPTMNARKEFLLKSTARFI